MSVRPAAQSDLAEVVEMRRRLWAGDDGLIDDDETVFVWEDEDGAIGGFVSASIRPWAEGCLSTPVPYIEGWFVREARRHAGIGRALVAAVERWATAAGFVELGSDVRLDNLKSLRAHRRLGFQPTERLQYFRKDLGQSGDEASFTIDRYRGPRERLRELFELAEDSPEQLAAYIDLGDVYVATAAERIVGHLQLTPAGSRDQLEIKNMAVAQGFQGRGIGRALVGAALTEARAREFARVLVGTAAADVDNLRFYQRIGFRILRVEHDAFTPVMGYPTPTVIDGIELRDRVWLGFDL
ncbi:MAG TPA: GNAT family N-acetyltransferase [Solirubrobacteraceae bacterium]